jgi:hypothetical protein
MRKILAERRKPGRLNRAGWDVFIKPVSREEFADSEIKWIATDVRTSDRDSDSTLRWGPRQSFA